MTPRKPHEPRQRCLKAVAGCATFLSLFTTALGDDKRESGSLNPDLLGLTTASMNVARELPEVFAVPIAARSFEFDRNELEGLTWLLTPDRAKLRETIRDPMLEEKRWGDAITMDPFVVVERTKVEYVPLPHRNRVIEAIKSGNLWKRVGRVVTSEAITRIEADAGGYGRLTIRIGFSW